VKCKNVRIGRSRFYVLERGESVILIVPKQHVLEVDELDDAVAKSIMDASKIITKAIKVLYKPDGVTICPALTGSKTPTSKFRESKEVRWGSNCP